MSLVYHNGRIVAGAVAIDPYERGLLLGDGLFETMLVVRGEALWRNLHLARMEGGANELGIAFERQAADEAIDALLARAGSDHHVLRLTVTRGVGARGLAGPARSPMLLASLDRFAAGQMFQPARILTSAIRRSATSLACRLKTLSYIDNVAAAREAASRGADDGLMLTTTGQVSCATVANVFVLKGKKLATPSRDQAILTGVMRQILLSLAPRLGLAAEERAVTRAELHRADAVFLTNSLRFLRPVTGIDGQPLSSRGHGPIVDALCEAARLHCGHDPRLI